MGVVIPQVITEDKADAAQIIEGSLRFDSSKSQYLIRTPSSSGNRRTFTFSAWFKRGTQPSEARVFNAASATDSGGSNPRTEIGFGSGDLKFHLNSSGSSWSLFDTSSLFRDSFAWYHIVWVLDTTQSAGTDQRKIYVNGILQTALDNSGAVTQNQDTPFNTANYPHILGGYGNFPTENNYDGLMSQVYFIDGQALTPSSFGYTDPLTNTWRPKPYKATSTIVGDTGSAVGFGTNGFWLPMDGNTPIGQDMSGKGNNWTPVNFGGSNTLEKATGALPILNTDGGGKVTRVGVRTDAFASNLVLALPFQDTREYTNLINSGQANIITTFTNNGAEYASPPAATSNDVPYGTAPALKLNNTGGSGYDYYRPTFSAGTLNFLHNQTGSGTVEFWFRHAGFNGEGVIWGTTNGTATAGMSAYMTSSTSFAVYISKAVSGSNLGSTASISLPQNEWHHIAITKTTSEVRVYVDGVFKSNFTFNTADASNINSGNNYLQMGQNSGEEGFRGWNDAAYYRDFRIYNTVKYTQNFIPASTDPDILPDTPSGVAYSSNVVLAPTNEGAVSLSSDGSGDYLSLSASSDFGFSTPSGNSNDFTIEWFKYWTSLSGYQTIWSNNYISSPGLLIQTGNGDGKYRVFVSSGTEIFQETNAATTGKWYHYALVRNGTTYTLYRDGIANGSATSSSAAGSGSDAATIGQGNGSYYENGFISNFHVVKGTALYTSNFTPPTAPISSVANTKLLCCKSRTSATVFDVSPGTITANGDAGATNINPFTVNINTQRGQESGYCTWNPLTTGSYGTISNGNLDALGASVSDNGNFRGTLSFTTGKWYVEMLVLVQSSTTYPTLGINPIENSRLPDNGGTNQIGYPTNSVAYEPEGYKRVSNSRSAWGSSFTVGDVIGMAVDADNGAVYYSKNGVWQQGGVPTSGATKTGAAHTWTAGSIEYVIASAQYNSSKCSFNFGQKPFKFPPPAGFQPLALANLPRPTIVRPDQYVGIVTYTGNATSRSINVGFKPDLVWLKRRGTTSESHVLANTVVGANAFLSSDLTNAENTAANCVTGFTNNGFTVGTQGIVNDNTMPFVAWCWKAGGNSNTYNINDVGYATASAAGLTAGTITPTGASVNTKSGFSIITYTGTGSAATVGHGLGVAPRMVIVKRRNGGGTENWMVYHASITTPSSNPAANRVLLNLTNTSNTDSAIWNDTQPTSTVFSVGTSSEVNANTGTYVAYCFAPVPGYSSFGSYTGNGSTDGPMVITGFRPRWVMIKNTGYAGQSWWILDTARDDYNVTDNYLQANNANAEGTFTVGDILSNGFKIRTTDFALNRSGDSIIYAAFAETPSFNLYGGQANAR